MLIKLKKSIPFSRRALPICLFKNVTAAPGNLAAATGYGIIFEGVKNIDSTLKKGFLPEDDMNFNRTTLLHETPLKIQDINHCKTFATNNKICAGGIMHGTTPGDSGGPLLLVRNNRWVQYGITSYGNYESVPNDVKKVSDRGVYIKVSAYCDWIKDKTSGDIKCQ
uniref:Peptidase S1 domain-containing protein n=1 Tax=Panagrolaimus davidi TaxID=227884 RepID=A0A914PX41_9BILA